MTIMTRYELSGEYDSNRDLLDFIGRIDTEFDTEGRLLFAGRRNTLGEFCIAEGHPVLGHVVVKRFNVHGPLASIVYGVFRRSKAQRAFRSALRLMEAGCSTPQPIGWIEVKSGMLLRRCYYICTYTEAQSVRTELEMGRNMELATSFAHFIARMHSHGIVHHDLNLSNVLYELDADGRYVVSVIDINRTTYTPPSRLSLRSCIDDFVRWTDDPELFEHVMRRYAEARNLDPEAFLAKAWGMKRWHDVWWKVKKWRP